MIPQMSNRGDRLYINSGVELLESEARTATTSSVVQNPDTAATFIPRGVHVFLNVTAIVATPSVVVRVQGFEGLVPPVFFYDQLVSDPIVDVGIYVFKVAPNIQWVPMFSAVDYIADFWRVRVEHGNANSITYAVTAKLFS